MQATGLRLLRLTDLSPRLVPPRRNRHLPLPLQPLELTEGGFPREEADTNRRWGCWKDPAPPTPPVPAPEYHRVGAAQKADHQQEDPAARIGSGSRHLVSGSPRCSRPVPGFQPVPHSPEHPSVCSPPECISPQSVARGYDVLGAGPGGMIWLVPAPKEKLGGRSQGYSLTERGQGGNRRDKNSL